MYISHIFVKVRATDVLPQPIYVRSGSPKTCKIGACICLCCWCIIFSSATVKCNVIVKSGMELQNFWRGRLLYSAGRPSHWPHSSLYYKETSFLQRAQCSHCQRCISYSNSVSLSVCPSHAGIVSKRQHVARCSLHRWIAKFV